MIKHKTMALTLMVIEAAGASSYVVNRDLEELQDYSFRGTFMSDGFTLHFYFPIRQSRPLFPVEAKYVITWRLFFIVISYSIWSITLKLCLFTDFISKSKQQRMRIQILNTYSIFRFVKNILRCLTTLCSRNDTLVHNDCLFPSSRCRVSSWHDTEV